MNPVTVNKADGRFRLYSDAIKLNKVTKLDWQVKLDHDSCGIKHLIYPVGDIFILFGCHLTSVIMPEHIFYILIAIFL